MQRVRVWSSALRRRGAWGKDAEIAAKKRQTFGKLMRERERAEKRARKQEKKDEKKAAALAAREAEAAGIPVAPTGDDELVAPPETEET
jgi:hypothetical protein